MRNRLERYLRRLYFGSDTVSWDPAKDEQVFAPEPALDRRVHEAHLFRNRRLVGPGILL